MRIIIVAIDHTTIIQLGMLPHYKLTVLSTTTDRNSLCLILGYDECCETHHEVILVPLTHWRKVYSTGTIQRKEESYKLQYRHYKSI